MITCTRPVAVRRLAMLGMAAALVTGSMAYGQAPTHSAMDPQNSPAAQSGNVGGRTVPTNAKDMGLNPGGMAADQIVNGQLVKFASSPDTMGDQAFALMAAAGNMTEVATSKAILEKTTDDKVKQLAQTIIDEHGMAQQKLEPIAKKLGVELPTSLPTMHQAEVDALKNASPETATKMYLSMQKADHLKTVSMYNDKVNMLKDPELKAYATEALPHLRMHTAKVIAANEAMGMPLDLQFKDGGHTMPMQ